MKKTLITVGLCLGMASTQAAIEAELTQNDFVASVCNVERMTVDASIDQASDEPIVKGRLRWEAGRETASDCLAADTIVYLEIGERFGEINYVRLDPDIRSSGEGYGISITGSPSWDRLFCAAAASSAACLSADEAKAFLAAGPAIQAFKVVTNSMARRKREESDSSRSRKKASKLDLDSMLDETIGLGEKDRVEDQVAGEEQQPGTRSVRNAFAKTTEEASRNVITLLSSSLAQYETPPSNCESSRRVANWVQANSVCQLTFRTEVTHAYTCTDDGRPEQVLSSQSAVVDFRKDVVSVGDPLISADGWVAVVVRFSNALAVSGSDQIKGDRWQFAGSMERVGEMKDLAGNLRALQQHCGDST